VVAPDRVPLGLDLGEDGGVLGALAGVPTAMPGLGCVDRICDQARGAGVEVAESLQDGGVGFAGGQPWGP
jgi:hypothetical protein